MTDQPTYPLLITDSGKTVKPLTKKPVSNHNAGGNYNSMIGPSKELTEQAIQKAIHTGFTAGEKVIIHSEHTHDITGEVVGFKSYVEKPYFRYGKSHTVDNVSVVRCRVQGSTTYVSAYALSELELV